MFPEIFGEPDVAQERKAGGVEKALSTYLDTMAQWASNVDAQNFVKFLENNSRADEAQSERFAAAKRFPSQKYLAAFRQFSEGKAAKFNEMLAEFTKLADSDPDLLPKLDDFKTKQVVLAERARGVVTQLDHEQRIRSENLPLARPIGQPRSETPVLRIYLDAAPSPEQMVRVLGCFPQIRTTSETIRGESVAANRLTMMDTASLITTLQEMIAIRDRGLLSSDQKRAQLDKQVNKFPTEYGMRGRVVRVFHLNMPSIFNIQPPKPAEDEGFAKYPSDYEGYNVDRDFTNYVNKVEKWLAIQDGNRYRQWQSEQGQPSSFATSSLRDNSNVTQQFITDFAHNNDVELQQMMSGRAFDQKRIDILRRRAQYYVDHQSGQDTSTTQPYEIPVLREVVAECTTLDELIATLEKYFPAKIVIPMPRAEELMIYSSPLSPRTVAVEDTQIVIDKLKKIKNDMSEARYALVNGITSGYGIRGKVEELHRRLPESMRKHFFG